MSLNDVEGLIRTVQDNETQWVLRNLHKTVQFRTKPEEDQQDQYREVLRCVVSRDLEGITDINTIYHEVYNTPQALSPLIPKGGTTQINVQTGTGGAGSFSDWRLTAQRFDELQQDGGKMYRETREYVSISNSEIDGSGDMWEDFDWF